MIKSVPEWNPAGPPALPGEPQLPRVLQVVAAQVQGPEAAQVAEGGLGEAPQVVGGQVEPPQLGEAGEGVRVDLHDDVGPLIVARAHRERPQPGEAGEGQRGQTADLAALQGKRAEAREVAEVVRPVGDVGIFGGLNVVTGP